MTSFRNAKKEKNKNEFLSRSTIVVDYSHAKSIENKRKLYELNTNE